LAASPEMRLAPPALRYAAHALDSLGLVDFRRSVPPLETISGISLAQPTHDVADGVGYAPHATAFRTPAAEPYTLQQPQRFGGMTCLAHAARYMEWFRLRRTALNLTAPADLLAPLRDGRAQALMMTELQATLLYPPPAAGIDALVRLPDALLRGFAGAPLPWPTAAETRSSPPWPFSQLARVMREALSAPGPDARDDVERGAPLANVPVYNVALSYLHRGPAKLYARDGAVADSCTMVMTVYDRYADVMERLNFYHTALGLRGIHIVWNAIDHTPPVELQKGSRAFRVPVTLEVQERNSMNNRFRPHPRITTDCVLNMDDDWNMPHQVMFFAIRLWRHRFSDRIVGLSNLARLHGGAGHNAAAAGYGRRSHRSGDTAGQDGANNGGGGGGGGQLQLSEAGDDDDDDGDAKGLNSSRDAGAAVDSASLPLPLPLERAWLYLKNSSAPQSMALPSGMVYHRRYMAAYSAPHLAAARRLVDKLVNCDDILFNFVVANATGLPPAFVDTRGVRRVHVIRRLGKEAGLWTRSAHLRHRDRCLDAFALLYGCMPLRYTRELYTIDDHLGAQLVSPDAIALRSAAPLFCTLDDRPGGTCKNDCVLCSAGRDAG
jgi:hypothetical protein